LQSALDVLEQAGADIFVNSDGIRVARNGAGIRPVTVVTAPFPGFPTDLQAQLVALMVCAQGASEITETIFENRFMHVQELARFGAKISLRGETARIEGIALLRGAPVMATDLRASVSLVIAGLAAEGETMVNRIYHLDRGFERLEDKLKACGATIARINDQRPDPAKPSLTMLGMSRGFAIAYAPNKPWRGQDVAPAQIDRA